MEMNNELYRVMEKLEKTNRQQAMFARIQCIFSVVAAVCCLLLLLTVAKIVPDIRDLSAEISGIAAQAETVLTNLETVSDELAAADLEGLVTDVDTLVTASQEGVESAIEKLNTIDIQTLNKAIKDLADLVEPLARVANIFGKYRSAPSGSPDGAYFLDIFSLPR